MFESWSDRSSLITVVNNNNKMTTHKCSSSYHTMFIIIHINHPSISPSQWYRLISQFIIPLGCHKTHPLYFFHSIKCRTTLLPHDLFYFILFYFCLAHKYLSKLLTLLACKCKLVFHSFMTFVYTYSMRCIVFEMLYLSGVDEQIGLIESISWYRKWLTETKVSKYSYK